MTNKTEYELFNGRYTAIVGSKGGLTLRSNLPYARNEGIVKINGKGSKRYSNMTAIKGGTSGMYLLSDIKLYTEGVYSTLEPIDHDELDRVFNSDLNVYDKILPINNIMLLEDRCKSDKGNEVFTQDGQGYKIVYTLYKHYSTSNGILKGHFQITMTVYEDGRNKNLYSKTEEFPIENNICVNCIEDLTNDDIEELKILINDL